MKSLSDYINESLRISSTNEYIQESLINESQNLPKIGKPEEYIMSDDRYDNGITVKIKPVDDLVKDLRGYWYTNRNEFEVEGLDNDEDIKKYKNRANLFEVDVKKERMSIILRQGVSIKFPENINITPKEDEYRKEEFGEEDVKNALKKRDYRGISISLSRDGFNSIFITANPNPIEYGSWGWDKKSVYKINDAAIKEFLKELNLGLKY
ncbi:MAG: hypothetical protein J1F35_06690 [Erysipelotrichales bacterium]|nr:hypothetical protein [Erysipelotrichales bacterium]